VEPVTGRHRGFSGGFSLLELLTVITIVAILALLVMPVTEIVRKRTYGIRCMGGMRSIVTSFHTYLQDHERVWPQPPQAGKLKNETAFWLATLQPYGGGDIKAWHCPALMHTQGTSKEVEESLHYAPTLFDGKPGTATKWSNMPWLMEVGDFHGRGALAAFSDGSVRPLAERK
jgi:prepilin-type N-terminal cleavage/methylation domain-containing protein